MRRNVSIVFVVALVVSLTPLLSLSSQPIVSAQVENTPTSWSLGAVNTLNWGFTDTIQRKGAVENYVENLADNFLIENYPTYCEVWATGEYWCLDNEGKEQPHDGSYLVDNIPADWINFDNSTFVSFQRPGTSTYTFGVEVTEFEQESEELKEKLKVKFKLVTNELTSIVINEDVSAFNGGYYFNERRITPSQILELYDELYSVPVSVDIGSVEVQSFSVPGEYEIEVELERQHVGYALAKGKFGSHSVTWTVSSQTDWGNARASSSQVTTSGGVLKLAQYAVWSGWNLAWSDSTAYWTGSTAHLEHGKKRRLD